MAFLSLAALTPHTLPFALSAGINLLVCALFGGYFLFPRRQKPEIRWFALYNLCVAAWSLFYLLWQMSETADAATLFTRLLMAFATLLPLLYLLFTLRFLGRTLLPGGLPILYGLFGGHFLLCLFTNQIVDSIAPRGGFTYWPVAGPLLAPLLLLWFGVIITTCVFLGHAATHAVNRRRKGQVVVMLAGNLLAYAGGATNFFLWYGVPILPWGNSAALALPLATLYAVAAYHLFDLRLFVKKTLIYSGMLAFVLVGYSLITAITTSLAGKGSLPSARYLAVVALSVFIPGLAFPRLNQAVNALLDHTLFRRQRQQEAILQSLALELNRTGELGEAMPVVLRQVRETFGLRHAAAVLWREDEIPAARETNEPPFHLHLWQSGYPDTRSLTPEKLKPLSEYLALSEPKRAATFSRADLSAVVDAEERALKNNPDRYDGAARRRHARRQAVVRRLLWLDVEAVAPLRGEKGLLGVLLLGSREQGAGFDAEMLALLDIVAAHTVSAIQKAKLLEEDRMKEEFVKVAAHELTAPIAAMDGYLAMVLDEARHGAEVDRDARVYLMNSRISVQRLTSMVRDLLSVSRIEGGRMTFTMKPVDVVHLVQDVLGQLRFLAKEKGLSVRFDPPRRVPHVYADPERLMQVLINLLSNAIKYTPKGYVEVTIAVHVPRRRVEITVRDTGLGMTPEALGRLFQKFSRIQTEETTSIQGTGLGLFITKSLVEGMDGTITVTSRPGKGSAFTVALPVASGTGSGREREMLADHQKQNRREIKGFIPIDLD